MLRSLSLWLRLPYVPAARPSRVWAQNALEKRFDQLDKNGDGKILPTNCPLPSSSNDWDLDGNGEITKPEAARASGTRGVQPYVEAPAPGHECTDGANADGSSRAARAAAVLPGDHRIGHFVPDACIRHRRTLRARHKLGELAKASTIVFAMTSTSCPLSKKYLPTLVDLVESSETGVTWVLVNPMSTDKLAEMQTAASQFNGKAIYVHDKDGQLAATLGALTTTDVIVLDASRTVVYHGAIDDQYGFGYSIEAPRYRYLADALAAIRAGKQPLVAATEAPGCTLGSPQSSRRQRM
ncbi:MAG: redoxin family protein [Planctomycetaceae bacterium]